MGRRTARAIGFDPETAREGRRAGHDPGRGGRARVRCSPGPHVYRLDDPPDYEPPPEASIAAEAARLGVAPEALAYDLLIADGGHGLLYLPFLNYADGDLDAAREMLTHPHAVLGLADGGAHVGTICDASFPTTMLTHWVRDRQPGPAPPSGARGGDADRPAPPRMSASSTGASLAPGMRADLNVIDLDGLRLQPPTIAFDLPAGGKRFLQRADGYLHTFVAGEETYASGEATGALPGRLVRGSQPPPR